MMSPDRRQPVTLLPDLDTRLRLRAIAPSDLDFLQTVYASTRLAELQQVPWSDAEKQAFITMQFQAQHQHYQQHYTHTSFDLILLDDNPVGRLYLGRWTTELRIVDITLLPAYRRQGIGSYCLHRILAEATAHGLPVRIHVERFNPALTLYHRLGFRLLEDKEIYLFLEWLSPHDHQFKLN